MRRVVWGSHSLDFYRHTEHYAGAIVGRVANRIKEARFTLEGHEYKLPPNEGKNMLHGGAHGLGTVNWKMQASSDRVLLTHTSPDGDMGFPGEARFRVEYRLEDYRLHIEMSAEVSRVTPINLAAHSYFNLAGSGDVLDHKLQIPAAKSYLVVDRELIPTGEVRAVEGTPYDFTQPRDLRDQSGQAFLYDNYLAFTARDMAAPAVTLTAPDNSLSLKLWTDQPGIQIYNGAHFGYGGLALEDNGYIDAVNHKEFPTPFVAPERPYRHLCSIEIR
jgi:aldose 1-epimerase